MIYRIDRPLFGSEPLCLVRKVRKEIAYYLSPSDFAVHARSAKRIFRPCPSSGTHQIPYTPIGVMPTKGKEKKDPLKVLTNPSGIIKLSEELQPRARKPSLKAAEAAGKYGADDEEMEDPLEDRITQGISQMSLPIQEYVIGLVEDRMRDGEMIEKLVDKVEKLEKKIEEQQAILLDNRNQLEMIQAPQPALPLSYAAVAVAAPREEPGNNRTGIKSPGLIPTPRAMRTMPTSLFCTVEAGNVTEKDKEELPLQVKTGIEKAICTTKGQPKWNCLAVLQGARNPGRVRILCRDEEEFKKVKKAAEQTKPEGGRFLRDQLYPVKMDSVATRVILNPDGFLRDDARMSLEVKNKVKIAKMVWLSNRAPRKAYRSMAVSFSKGEQAIKALKTGFFSVGGESVYTNMFETRKRPTRCHNC